ncbi:hypothetical protein GCM10027258_63190 [Amycolatopsis stemonae]
MSHDKFGKEKSPDDQHRDHGRTAKERGWKLVGPSYRDLVSASKFGPEHRKDFERLIEDLEFDRFGAKILMMWENSRGSRRESEWIKLIDLAELRGVVFWIEMLGKIMDPADPHDRRELVKAAADAAYESALISFRSCRGTREAATDGKPHGRIPYGYRRIYDDRTGEFLEQVPEETEAPIVRELFRRVRRGESIRSVAERFKERGVEKRSGGPFTPAHLRTILINEAYAGIRIHDPDRKAGRPKLGPRARKVQAVWKGLVSKKTFDDVQRLLSEPERKTTRDGGARHLLSMIAKCAVCGSVVSARPCRTSGELRYACHSAKGCSRVGYDDLDRLATGLMLAWLADPDCYGVLGRADAAANERLGEVRADLDKAIADRDELAERVGRNEPGFSLAFAAKVAAGIEERIAKLEAEEKALRPSILEGLIEPGPDVAERWKKLQLDSKRRIARSLLVPEYVGEIQVKPVGRGRRAVPVPLLDRVRVYRRAAA